MKLIDRKRGSGKTTRLIYTSEITGYPIITRNKQSVDFIKQQAQNLNANIPQPMTIDEVRSVQGIRLDKVLVDEGLSIIEEALNHYLGVKVAAVTFTQND